MNSEAYYHVMQINTEQETVSRGLLQTQRLALKHSSINSRINFTYNASLWGFRGPEGSVCRFCIEHTKHYNRAYAM